MNQRSGFKIITDDERSKHDTLVKRCVHNEAQFKLGTNESLVFLITEALR